MTRPPLRRILAVEDESDLRAVLDLCLREVGQFEVLLCASGEEALAKAPGFAPDLFLLDVMMPGLDGPGTLQGLRALGCGAPAFFLTAKVQAGDVADLLAAGAAAVVPKPFDPMALPEELRARWDAL
ncbi:MAG TPA: response regulator [Holophagaceae bacterium]|nr:response regulator [Holophagaceae bacterium]